MKERKDEVRGLSTLPNARKNFIIIFLVFTAKRKENTLDTENESSLRLFYIKEM